MPAVPHARYLIGREPQGSGWGCDVGCARVGHARAEREGARAAPQFVTARPPAARPLLTLACRQNPATWSNLVCAVRGWRRFNGGISAFLSEGEKARFEWGGAQAVPPGGLRGASLPLSWHSRPPSGTSVQPRGAVLEPLRAPDSCDPARVRWDGAATKVQVVFASRLRTPSLRWGSEETCLACICVCPCAFCSVG